MMVSVSVWLGAIRVVLYRRYRNRFRVNALLVYGIIVLVIPRGVVAEVYMVKLCVCPS